MTASTFQIFALAVLAVDLIEDLEISRTALGILGSVNTLIGAVSAPAIGRFTDRIGAGRATVIVLVVSAIGMAIMAAGNNIWMLGLSAVISGVPQGWGNPATNALIASRVPAGSRGTITGLKQSGVQFGIFLSGLTLPTLSIAFGWRGAMWFYAGLSALAAIFVHYTLGPDHPSEVVSSESAGSSAGSPVASQPGRDATADTGLTTVGRLIWLLAIYGFLLGSSGGAVGRFLPLWAHEVVGMSTTTAGFLVAFGGLLGIAARIVAGRVTERVSSPPALLSVLAVIGAMYCSILIFTPPLPAWLLWPTSILAAVGIGAWNAVAMLTVIMYVHKSLAGRASGIVMLGFLGGLSFGAPAAGWVVDEVGSYQPVWIACALGALAGAFVLLGNFRFETPVATSG